MLASLTRCVLAALAVSGAVGSAVPRDCPPIGPSVVVEQGDSVGVLKNISGVQTYITKPKGYVHKPDVAVLYLSDIRGIQYADNRRLADSFARAGYLTVAPDMFNGNPAPDGQDRPDLNFTVVAFLDAHPPNITDPIVEGAVRYMRQELGVHRIGVTGYCFGGRHAFRVASPDKRAAGIGVDVVATSHPTRVTDDEILARAVPATVAAAEFDPALMPPERRAQIEAALMTGDIASTLTLYSGVEHGFGVTANLSDPQGKFGKEGAFLQSVQWFDYWL